jgi:hypothetical protein
LREDYFVVLQMFVLLSILFAGYWLRTTLGSIVWLAFRTIAISTKFKDNWIEDITSQAISPPPQAEEPIKQLEALNYEPIGIIRGNSEGLPDFQMLSWLYIHKRRQIVAEVNPLDHQVVEITLSSWFADETSVETNYPILRHKVSQRDFVSQYVSVSLEEAIQQHENLIKEWSLVHSSPILIQDMKTYLQWGQFSLDQFFKRKVLLVGLGEARIEVITFIFALPAVILGIISFFEMSLPKSIVALVAGFVLLIAVNIIPSMQLKSSAKMQKS